MIQCTLCNQEFDNGRAGSFMSVVLYDDENNETITPWACEECASRNGLRWCPECGPYHAPNNGWYTDTGVRSAVPCPEHSVNLKRPAANCVVCNTTVNGEVDMDCHSRVYCHTHAGQIDTCGYRPCRAEIHPSLDTEHTRRVPELRQPGRTDLVNFVLDQDGRLQRAREDRDRNSVTKHYCSELCKVASGLNIRHLVVNHIRLWDYSPNCVCEVCDALREADNDRWEGNPVLAVSPCHNCGYVSAPHVEVREDLEYCHVCAVRNLHKCSACDKWHLPVASISTRNPLCGPCLENKGYWYCGVRCATWFPPTRDNCPCGGVYRHDFQLAQEQLNFMVSPGQKAVKKKDIPFLGLEIEVEAQQEPATRRSGARYIHNTIGEWAYPVHDGSLMGNRPDGDGGDAGFEIVTHPMSFEWFNDNWSTIKGILNGLTDRGFRSWEGQRCGMHIHISRAAMSEAHQLRFIRFYYGHPMLAMCIGQRGSNDQYLRRFAPFDREPHGELIAKIRDFRNPGIRGHYAAINGTKRHTLECRWFRGTLMPASFRKNVEFVHAGWAFTGEYGNTSANEMNFIKWLREPPQSVKYATLLSFIEDNYITKQRRNK